MFNSRIEISAILLVLAVAAWACGGSRVEVNTPSSGSSDGASVPTAAAVQPTATTAPVGSARSNPAPAGSEVLVEGMAFVVTGSTRPATDIIMSGNQFNTRPEAGQEYVMVDLRIVCQKSADEKCNFSSYNLKLLGSSGIQRDPQTLVAGVSGLLDSFGTEFFGGAAIEGRIPFIVNSDETDLLLVYSPLFGNPFYLSIE